MPECRKKVCPPSAFLSVVNCVSPSSAFRHNGQPVPLVTETMSLHQKATSSNGKKRSFFCVFFLSFFLFYSQGLNSDKRVIFITFLTSFFYERFTVHNIDHDYHQIKTRIYTTNYDNIREKKIGCGDGRCCPCWTGDD
jgi:hypothetical protein